MEKPKVEEYIRCRDVALRWGIAQGTVVRIFKHRSGVINLPYGEGFILLIPPDDIDDYVWTIDELAEDFPLPKGALRELFRNEPGVFRTNGRLQIPESVRRKVFLRHRNP